jgi:hypothetical protein
MGKVIRKAKIKPAKKSKLGYVFAIEKAQMRIFDSIEKKLMFGDKNKVNIWAR